MLAALLWHLLAEQVVILLAIWCQFEIVVIEWAHLQQRFCSTHIFTLPKITEQKTVQTVDPPCTFHTPPSPTFDSLVSQSSALFIQLWCYWLSTLVIYWEAGIPNPTLSNPEFRQGLKFDTVMNEDTIRDNVMKGKW